MADSLSTRARALLEATGKPPQETRDYNRFLGELRRDAPDIARAYLEAVEEMMALMRTAERYADRVASQTFDTEIARCRAWLERHESEGVPLPVLRGE